MTEAVVPPTSVAVYAGCEGGIDQRLAAWLRALALVREDARLRRRSPVDLGRSGTGPCPGVGADMGSLSAVVEAECASTTGTFEGEEVKLVTEGGLTVGADCFDVADGHAGVCVLRCGCFGC